MIYHYLICYNYKTDNAVGLASTDVTSSNKISTVEEIRSMEAKVAEKQGYNNVVILNMVLLRKEWWKWL